MRIRFQVSGKSKFARLFAKTGVPVNFDVRWVLHPSHWTVNAVKVANDSKVADYRSRVWFASRTMILFSLAVRPYTAGNAAGVAVPGSRPFHTSLAFYQCTRRVQQGKPEFKGCR